MKHIPHETHDRDINELADRVEKLDGPCRETDMEKAWEKHLTVETLGGFGPYPPCFPDPSPDFKAGYQAALSANQPITEDQTPMPFMGEDLEDLSKIDLISLAEQTRTRYQAALSANQPVPIADIPESVLTNEDNTFDIIWLEPSCNTHHRAIGCVYEDGVFIDEWDRKWPKSQVTHVQIEADYPPTIGGET